MTAELELADWRRRVAALYAAVRGEPDFARGHALWRSGRDALFRDHPQSPLLSGDRLRSSGLPYWPYDERLRFVVPLLADADRDEPPIELSLPSAADGTTTMRRIGVVELGSPIDAAL